MNGGRELQLPPCLPHGCARGEFSRAAAQLGVSQSALSHTIRALESRLGVRLLTRTTRSVSPTEAGKRLLLTVGPRFEEIETELAALSALRDKPAGTVRITTAEHAANTILWPKLANSCRTTRMQQRRASAHTIASYRDTFRMLLQFVHKRLRKAPSALALDDIDAPLVMAFLDEMGRVRGITARTRNLRLTAVHSFYRFAAFEAPSHLAQIQRVLAIPAKRFPRALVPFLSRQEVDALLAAPDQRSWSGRRDHSLLLLAVQTGLRLSELTSLRREDLHVGTGAHVRVIGKGRKERCTPLSKNTRAVLAAWAREPPRAQNQPLFPNARGGRLSAHGVHYLLNKHVAMATVKCPSTSARSLLPPRKRSALSISCIACSRKRTRYTRPHSSPRNLSRSRQRRSRKAPAFLRCRHRRCGRVPTTNGASPSGRHTAPSRDPEPTGARALEFEGIQL